ncbi:MAG: bifunctional (p)ppGpp synthetase/guanosine-3',5'-bis(diphosphate) 3'-pyrophosphohydrolase [Deltaproteobacteria bacterium]|nr:bifunctional (p)ppGpp synthetase/guanosine-3',5'-bis(diphosphate) 3'-pyrophosphohydrolase [Deltaproteobacteria bacterium]
MERAEDILERIASYNPSADLEIVKKAYIFSAKVHQGQVRISGEPYMDHPIEVASVLTHLKLDPLAIATGFLHDTVEDTHTTIEKIKEVFGEEVAALVDGVTKISKITFNSKEEKQAENFRKMIIAMSKDIRIILIKLADRLHNMRTLHALPPDRQIKIAQETLDIYAPLANRLGIGWIKTELEDLALRHINTEKYKEIEAKLAKGKIEREHYIKEVIDILEKTIKGHGLEADITGRQKHTYSILRKMENDGVDIEHIFDIIAFRIVVGSITECYHALGIIHNLWKPVPGRIKDFIAIPKPNMYQSLHTTVVGPRGDRIEIQIRTHEMHKIAEYGIAAHWRYKEGRSIPDKDDKRFAWLRQLMEWQKELKDPAEFMETVRVDLFQDEVFVFTPKGDVKEFPKDATPVDFAYSVHTDIGHRCSAAKVNGRLVPLKSTLKNGDVVEIITSSNHNPSKDWLKFVVTSKAKTNIRQWIKIEERGKSIALGKEMCEKEFKKYELDINRMLKDGTLEDTAKTHFNMNDANGLLAGIGYGKISAIQILGKILPSERLKPETEKGISKFKKVLQRIRKPASGDGIIIKGIDNVMIRFAKCCNPLPGDKIIGFVSRGRGVTIHARLCPNVMDTDPERRIEADWGKGPNVSRPARITVVCHDTKGVLADMSAVIAEKEANISSADVNTTPDKKAICTFEIQVNDLEHLNNVIKSLQQIKKVIKVQRVIS